MDPLPRLIGDVPRVYLDVERIHPFFCQAPEAAAAASPIYDRHAS